MISKCDLYLLADIETGLERLRDKYPENMELHVAVDLLLMLAKELFQYLPKEEIE
jgi:hypothetical protein